MGIGQRDIHPTSVTLTWADYMELQRRYIEADDIAQYALVKLLQHVGANFRIPSSGMPEADEYAVSYMVCADEMIEFQLRKKSDS